MFSFIKRLLTPKVIFVSHSELSNPTQCERVDYQDPKKQQLAVLDTLSKSTQMKASDMDRYFPSGGRRLNELFHKGLVDNVWNKSRMVYRINDRWYALLLTR